MGRRHLWVFLDELRHSLFSVPLLLLPLLQVEGGELPVNSGIQRRCFFALPQDLQAVTRVRDRPRLGEGLPGTTRLFEGGE